MQSKPRYREETRERRLTAATAGSRASGRLKHCSNLYVTRLNGMLNFAYVHTMPFMPFESRTSRPVESTEPFTLISSRPSNVAQPTDRRQQQHAASYSSMEDEREMGRSPIYRQSNLAAGRPEGRL